MIFFRGKHTAATNSVSALFHVYFASFKKSKHIKGKWFHDLQSAC